MLKPDVTAYVGTPGAPRLLVVDDDDVMRQLATCTLQQAGYFDLQSPNAVSWHQGQSIKDEDNKKLDVFVASSNMIRLLSVRARRQDAPRRRRMQSLWWAEAAMT